MDTLFEKERRQRFSLSDELWEHLEPFIPVRKSCLPKGGRPPLPPRVVADAIFFVLRTGCQWKAIARESHGCCGSLAHLRFQEWVEEGVFQRFWEAGLHKYDEVRGIDWRFQAMDGAITKSPLGGALRGPIPQIEANRARKDLFKLTPLVCLSG